MMRQRLDLFPNPFDDPQDVTPTVLKSAEIIRFDPAGYRVNRPLRKGIFYTEPYLTCRHCNIISFIDVTKARYFDVLKNIQEFSEAAASLLPVLTKGTDKLPPCRKCLRVDGYVHGAYDFTDDIEETKRRREARIKLERDTASKLVRFYRHHLFRLYGKSLLQAKRTLNYLQYAAAVKINAAARGRLSRRRYVTERYLKMIKISHPLLIHHALKVFPGKAKLFWYKRPIELKLLYADYLDLIEKTGNHPPRMIVEKNIAQMYKRILERKHELIRLLQKRWRGFLARRIVKYFRQEIARMFSITVAKVLRIQTIYRGHYIRLQLPKFKSVRLKEKLMSQYKKERRAHKLVDTFSQQKETVKLSYLYEKQSEKALHMVSKLPYPMELPENQIVNVVPYLPRSQYPDYYHPEQLSFQLQTFQQSCYGEEDKVVYGKYSRMMRNNVKVVNIEMLEIEQDYFRKEFIIDRIQEYGPLGFGLRGEIPALMKIDQTIVGDGSQSPIRSRKSKKIGTNSSKQKHITSNGVNSSDSNKLLTTDNNIIANQQVVLINAKSNGRQLDRMESKRTHYMRWYFQSDLVDISNRMLTRVNANQTHLMVHFEELQLNTAYQHRKYEFELARALISPYSYTLTTTKNPYYTKWQELFLSRLPPSTANIMGLSMTTRPSTSNTLAITSHPHSFSTRDHPVLMQSHTMSRFGPFDDSKMNDDDDDYDGGGFEDDDGVEEIERPFRQSRSRQPTRDTATARPLTSTTDSMQYFNENDENNNNDGDDDLGGTGDANTQYDHPEDVFSRTSMSSDSRSMSISMSISSQPQNWLDATQPFQPSVKAESKTQKLFRQLRDYNSQRLPALGTTPKANHNFSSHTIPYPPSEHNDRFDRHQMTILPAIPSVSTIDTNPSPAGSAGGFWSKTGRDHALKSSSSFISPKRKKVVSTEPRKSNLRKNFVYPKDVNFQSMKWLYSDMNEDDE